MKWTQWIVNAVRSKQPPPPRPGRLIVPRSEDTLRDYPSAGLTPSRLMGILREADAGELNAALQLFEEMEEKDAHLYSVANTRRLALTGLTWRLVSAADVNEMAHRRLADEAADYCRQVLTSLDHFDAFLQHLTLALGRNLAVGELVWDVVAGRLELVDLVPVDFARLVFNELDELRILTAEQPRDGITPPAHKFVVHTPHAVAGHAQRGGLLRVSAMVYLAKNMTLKDWLIYTEIFGMPVRVARYEPSATETEKREMLDMLETLGSHAAGVFSKAVELQFVEANAFGGGPPYEAIIDFLNRELSKAWLGQTLTTDTTGQRAALASTRIHEIVRKDILADDIRKEAFTIRRDLLTPLVRLRFGPDAPVPFFQRQMGQPRSVEELADVLDKAVNRLGIPISESWARAQLDLPPRNDAEPVLPGQST